MGQVRKEELCPSYITVYSGLEDQSQRETLKTLIVAPLSPQNPPKRLYYCQMEHKNHIETKGSD